MIKKFLNVLIFSSLIFFFFGEIFVRKFKPQKTYSDFLALLSVRYRYSDFIPFTLQTNYRAKMLSMEGKEKFVSLTVNSLGLRGAERQYKKSNGVKRILFLGDSYTFGLYVDDTQAYPAVLENLLRQEGYQVEVINAGYANGFSPDEMYAWLVNEGVKYEPDIIIYGFFIGNDIDDISKKHWRNLDKRDLPTKIVNPDLYIDDYGRIRVREKTSSTVGVEFIYRLPILRESQLFILFFQYTDYLRSKYILKEANKGWGSDPFPFILRKNSDDLMKEKENLFKKLVLGLDSVAKENQAKFLMILIPINFQIDATFLPRLLGNNHYSVQRNYFDELKPFLELERIPYIDLLELMKKNPGHYYPENGEVHFNAQGHYFTAEVLRRELIRKNWVQK